MQGFGASRGSDEAQGFTARTRVQLPALHELESLHPALESSVVPSEPRLQAYPNPRDLFSNSPGDPSFSGHDFYRPYFAGAAIPPPGHVGPSLNQNPKRAYRQRRKDPSCDACRERKVKCNATESTSCDECSSRNVRCQFTKDTNRRMSSMKQVQDLERQLQEARQELERVRSSEARPESPDMDTSSPSQTISELPSVGRSSRRLRQVQITQDLGDARENVTDFGRGLLRPPYTSGKSVQSETERFALPELPPLPAAEQLLRAYFDSFHRYFPVIYWPEFQQNFKSIYADKNSTSLSRENVALLLAVLACGAQRFRPPTHDQHGQKLLFMAVSSIDMWEDEISTARIVIAFLASCFLAEGNRRSAGLSWLSSAIRMAQVLGLHLQDGMWNDIEGEMRRRIWWSLFVWDRLLSTELGKPMLINDEDCDVEHPDTLDEKSSGVIETFQADSPNHILLIIPIAKLLSPISKLCRSLCVSNDTLTKFELHLGSCMDLFPPEIQLTSNSTIDPLNIAPLICFQNTRLMLHRHNLSPSCPPEQRSQAIERCASIACDTASIILRCVRSQSTDSDWKSKFITSANTFLCTHLWRCMLFLIFNHHYDQFQILLQVASLVENTKPINVNCGRNLGFFMRRLIDCQNWGEEARRGHYEELIVYLSGDLQSGTNSWIWRSAESSSLRRRPTGERLLDSTEEGTQGPSTKTDMTWENSLSENERENWGSWALVGRAADYLRHAYETGPAPASSSMTRPSGDSNRSRMDIANII